MNTPSPQLAALKARFIGGLGARLQRMQTQLAASAADGPSPALQREAHSLVGAAGIHGLEALATSAARLNHALVHHKPVEAITAHLNQVAEAIAQVTSLSTPPPNLAPVRGPHARIMVICQGEDERESLRSMLEAADWAVDAWPDPHTARTQGEQQPIPQVLVLGLQFGAGTAAGLQAIETATRHWPQVPVLVTTAHSDLSTRLAALRAGAAGVMVKPFAPEELLQRIQHIQRPQAGTGTTAPSVIVVSPAPPGTATQATVTPWPTHWPVVHSMDALSEALDRQAFGAVVLDGAIDGVSPAELTTLLQDGPCCGRLPVIWRTPSPDAQLQALAAQVGAAGVVDAHHPPGVLLAMVGHHTRQAQVHQDRMQRLQSALYELNQQRMALDHHATVSIADAQGHVVDASPRHARLTGFSPEQLIGAHLCEPRPGKAPPELPATALQVARDTGLWQGRLELRKADHSPCWVDATLVPFVDPAGRVYRYLLARSDVTRQVASDQAIEQLREAEMATASAIQSTLLVPPLPHCPAGVSVAARFQASGGVAGDFHELIELGPGVFDVLLGDVMGKGVPAALIGAAVKLELARCLSELSTRSPGQLTPPAAIVRALHQRLTPRLMALDTYVTLSYLRVEAAEHRLTSVGCGHPNTLLVHSGVALPLPNANLPLGILADEDYAQTEHDLPPGATLVLYSDGLSEATNSQGEAFGTERLAQAVIELTDGHADARLTADGLLARVHAHAQAETHRDDQTLVVLRTPAAGEVLASLPRSLAAIPALRHAIATCPAVASASEAVQDKLCLAAVEVFSNTVRHGQPTDGDTTIGLAVRHDTSGHWLELTDIGTPFGGAGERALPEPDTWAEGGYGLPLIHATCNEVRFVSQHGLNRCTLRIGPDPATEFAMSPQ